MQGVYTSHMLLHSSATHAANPGHRSLICRARTSSAVRCLKCRASSASEEEPITHLGDWREVRARLVQTEGVRPISARASEDNKTLLQIQNQALALEDTWAHVITRPEQGGILVASSSIAKHLGDAKYQELVVLLLEHGARGSVGLILNRPTGMLFGRKEGGIPFELVNAPATVQRVFAESRVYCGGYTAPTVIHLLHGQPLVDATEVVPGVWLGGAAAAAEGVQSGEFRADRFRVFAGALLWAPGELEHDVKRGCWIPAACSRNLLLKQCLQLPVPLWREILMLMGGEFVKAAEEAYERDQF